MNAPATLPELLKARADEAPDRPFLIFKGETYSRRDLELGAGGAAADLKNSGLKEGDRLALCLHGFPELGYSWRHQLPALAELGYRAWAPELRGYGQTDRPGPLSAYAIERLLEATVGDGDGSQRDGEGGAQGCQLGSAVTEHCRSSHALRGTRGSP